MDGSTARRPDKSGEAAAQASEPHYASEHSVSADSRIDRADLRPV